MIRIILGLVAGIFATVAVVVGLEAVAHILFTDPSERGPIPVALLLFVLLAYFLGTLAGALVALRVSGVRWTAFAIAAVVIAGAIASMFMIVHPLWMQIAAIAAPVLGALAALRLAKRPASHSAEAA